MKIIFVLFFVFADQRAGGAKIGEYERRAQCVQQGEMMKAAGIYNLNIGAFLCIPANATGTR